MTRTMILPMTGLALALSTVSVAAMEQSARGAAPEVTIDGDAAVMGASEDVLETEPGAPRAESDAAMRAAPTFDAVDAAIAAGVLPVALSTDGEVLGQIDSVALDSGGVAQYSVQLDPSLQLETPRVTYRGDAALDADGQVMLEISRASFVGAIMDHIERN